MTRVAVVGAGSWGTVLSAVLSKKGHDVCMWAFEPEVAEQITQGRENVSYLPGVKLPENLGSTAGSRDSASRGRNRGIGEPPLRSWDLSWPRRPRTSRMTP